MSESFPSFVDWLDGQIGTRNWFVGPRLTDGHRRRGYDMAISQKRFAEFEELYETEKLDDDLLTYGIVHVLRRDAVDQPYSRQDVRQRLLLVEAADALERQ